VPPKAGAGVTLGGGVLAVGLGGEELGGCAEVDDGLATTPGGPAQAEAMSTPDAISAATRTGPFPMGTMPAIVPPNGYRPIT
jgi:hypothetical protein